MTRESCPKSRVFHGIVVKLFFVTAYLRIWPRPHKTDIGL